MLIVTAYTDNGGYAEFVGPWLDSVLRHVKGHNLVLRYGKVDSWRTAAHLKPWAIKQALAVDNPLVMWLDVDAYVRKPFDLPFGDWDLAFRQYREHSMTGTLFLRNTDRVRRFVDEWWTRSIGSLEERNQLVFENLLREHADMKVEFLPAGYTFVDYDNRDRNVPDSERYIIHHLHAKTQKARK